ncbi:MAG: DNA-processing protein DprA [Actinomycetota bacterium]
MTGSISTADRDADIRARLSILRLPQMSPSRSRWLFADLTGPDAAVAAVERLRANRLPPEAAPAGMDWKVVAAWRAKLFELDLDVELARHAELGIGLLSPLDHRWPFAEDPEPPVLLFHTGDLTLLRRPDAVAVVGTRRCTTVGRTVAYELGRGLAGAGVTVISGLALGVDGAAHRGAMDRAGPVIGVVASGLDVVYPGGNRDLWHQVATQGLLVGEAPAGDRPQRWRFPARNRLIAGLSRGVVVVESHARGGALSTVDEAIERDRPVMAVPGSVLSAASDGTNGLLVEGAIPVRGADDVIGTLSFPSDGPDEPGATPGPTAIDPGPAAPLPPAAGPAGPDSARSGPASAGSGGGFDAGSSNVPDDPGEALEQLILAEVDTGPVHVDRLVIASGLAPAALLAQVQALATTGRLIVDGATVSRPC